MKIAFISARKDELSCKMLLQEFRKRQSFEAQIAHTDEQEWSREVKQYLDKADYVFILVSPAYFSTSPQRFPQINQIIHRSKFSSASQKVIALLICPSDWKESIIAECRDILPKEDVTITDDKGNPIISTCEMIAQTIFGPPHKKPFEVYRDYLKRSSTIVPKHLLQFSFASLLSKLQKFPRSIYLSSRNYVAVCTAAALFIIMLYFIIKPPFRADPPPTKKMLSNDSSGRNSIEVRQTSAISPIDSLKTDTIDDPPKDTIKGTSQPSPTPVPFFACRDGKVRRSNRPIITKPTKADVDKILSKYRNYSGYVKFKINIDTSGNVSAEIKKVGISPEMPENDLESFKKELINGVIKKIEFIPYLDDKLQSKSNTGSIDFYFNQNPVTCRSAIPFK